MVLAALQKVDNAARNDMEQHCISRAKWHGAGRNRYREQGTGLPRQTRITGRAVHRGSAELGAAERQAAARGRSALLLLYRRVWGIGNAFDMPDGPN